MGDPKRLRKKYSAPSHPWQKDRIAEENTILREYGLKNKLEVWRAISYVQKLRAEAKSFVSMVSDEEREKSKEFIRKLYNLGLLNSEDASMDDVLTLKVENVLDRRLQTLLYKQKLAATTVQARKFIVHKHVVVNGKVITSPSYMVSRDEESSIGFRSTSVLNKEDHPTRTSIKEKFEGKTVEEKEVKEEAKNDEKAKGEAQ